tara:strand:- start:69 stop:257 length:189 start_codon:yes stop_codon:yes gene_type:complete
MDAPEKLARELRAVVQRWRMEWNISTAELLGAVMLVAFELCLSEWSIIDNDESSEDEEEGEL